MPVAADVAPQMALFGGGRPAPPRPRRSRRRGAAPPSTTAPDGDDARAAGLRAPRAAARQAPPPRRRPAAAATAAATPRSTRWLNRACGIAPRRGRDARPARALDRAAAGRARGGGRQPGGAPLGPRPPRRPAWGRRATPRPAAVDRLALAVATRPGAGHGHDVAGSRSAPHRSQRGGSSTSPPQPRWRTTGAAPRAARVAVAPLHQRDDRPARGRGPSRSGGTRSAGGAPGSGGARGCPRPRVARGGPQHVARDAEAALEVVEAAHAEERVAHDSSVQRSPTHLEGAGHRAVLVVVGAAAASHVESSRLGCMRQPHSCYGALRHATASDARWLAAGRSWSSSRSPSSWQPRPVHREHRLPRHPRGLRAARSLAALSWILNAYAIVFAALLVPAGRLADRVGRRRSFLAGLALFTPPRRCAALAPSVALLVAARVLQAVGAARALPDLARAAAARVPARASARRRSALGARPAPSPRRPGPPLGGLLVQAGWRSSSSSTSPIGLVALVPARRAPARERASPRRAARPTLVGAVLLTAGVGAAHARHRQGARLGLGRRAACSARSRPPCCCSARSRCARRVTRRRSSSPRCCACARSRWRTSARCSSSPAFDAMLLGNVLFLTGGLALLGAARPASQLTPGPRWRRSPRPSAAALAGPLRPARRRAPGRAAVRGRVRRLRRARRRFAGLGERVPARPAPHRRRRGAVLPSLWQRRRRVSCRRRASPPAARSAARARSAPCSASRASSPCSAPRRPRTRWPPPTAPGCSWPSRRSARALCASPWAASRARNPEAVPAALEPVAA